MADPTPAERERSILGGRLLGTKPVVDGVKTMGAELAKFNKVLGEVRQAVEGQKRQISGGNRGSGGFGQAWNAASHWGGWGSQNGGGFRINGAASSLGLQNAGLTGLGTAGMPGNNPTYNIHTRQMVPGSGQQPFGGTTGAPMPYARTAIGATMGRMAIGAMAGGITQWADNNTASMDQRDLLAVRAYNNGGYSSIMAAQRRLAQGNATGFGVADQVQAQMMGQMNGGINGGLGRNRGSLIYGGMLNPAQSNVTGQQVQLGLTAAPRVNQLQMFGISALQGGNQRSTTDINDQILTRLGAAGPMTVKQRMATFRDQNSRLNQTLRSWGMDADTIESIQNQGAAQARIQQQGGDVGRFRTLLTRAGGTGKSARGARDVLRDEFDYKFSNIEERRQLAATNEDRNADTLKGFRDGVRQSTEALSGLSDAARRLMRITGTANEIGQAGGFLGQIGSGIGVGGAVGGALGGAAHMLGGMMAWRGAKRMLGGPKAIGAAGAAGSAGGRLAGIGSKLGRVAKFAGPLGVAIQAGENILHSKRAWDKGWQGGMGNESVGSMGWDMFNPAGAAGAVAGFGSMLGTLASGGDPWAGEDDEGRGAGEEVEASTVVSRAAQYARGGTNFGVGKCQTFVRSCYGSPGGAASAAAAWSAAKYKHPGDANPPAGASVFWVGGSRGYGHVAVSAGGGSIYSTDVKAPGRVALTTISWLNQHWGSLRYVGWSEDNNGIRCKVGGNIALSVGATSNPGGVKAGGSVGSSAGSAGGAAIMGAYGSVNEADAVSGALAGFAGATVGGSSGAQAAEGDTKGPGVTSGGGGARAIVQRMAAERGWTGAQWKALDNLVSKESGWNPKADNPTSSAAGLFQKMTSIHGPLEGSVQGQAKWGLNYIEDRYGNPAKAWSFWQQHNYYDKGAFEIEEDQKATVHKGEMIIPRGQAETIRQALLRENVGTQSSGSGSGGVRVTFERGSIVFTGHVGKGADARKFAKEIVTLITEDDRLEKMGVGR